MAPVSVPRPGCQHGAFLDVAMEEQRPSSPHKHRQPLPMSAASEDAGEEVTAPQPWAAGGLTGGSKRGPVPSAAVSWEEAGAQLEEQLHRLPLQGPERRLCGRSQPARCPAVPLPGSLPQAPRGVHHRDLV